MFLLLLKGERNLMERDDPPVVIPLLDQDMSFGTNPRKPGVQIGAADEENSNAALAHNPPILAGDRQEPLVAREG